MQQVGCLPISWKKKQKANNSNQTKPHQTNAQDNIRHIKYASKQPSYKNHQIYPISYMDIIKPHIEYR